MSQASATTNIDPLVLATDLVLAESNGATAEALNEARAALSSIRVQASDSVEIRDATGSCGSHCNGLFVCTGEQKNGCPLFPKVSDPDKWLCYSGCVWFMTSSTSLHLTTDECVGFCKSIEAHRAHPTLAQQWGFHDGAKWEVQAQVVAVLSDKVRLSFLNVHTSPSPDSLVQPQRRNNW